ncbi:MAG: hypothetical protein HYV16_15140 [Gammaproteobacteria bacterium]|nr:hypothetical protein [Gammaproteobacteria bacterium]
MTTNQRAIALSLSLLSLLIIFVYWPGLNGPFVFDDEPNIKENPALHIKDLSLDSLRNAAFSIKAGPLYRPISMSSLAANYYFSQLEPYAYKLTNLGVHLLATLALMLFANRLLHLYSYHPTNQESSYKPDIPLICLLLGALWGLHPLNLSSVLYIVQRMASLAAMFSFLALASYCHGRLCQLRAQRGWPFLILSLIVLYPLAIFSKENVVVLPLIMPTIECLLLPQRWQQTLKWIRQHRIMLWLALALPVAFCLWHMDYVLNGYVSRPFTLEERILTESRALWFYLQQIALPNISQLYLFHDDFSTSKGILSPLTTLTSLIAWCITFLGIWMLRRKHPLAAFSILFFLIGHLIESTIFALELVHEHRNYFPSFGPLLLLSVALTTLCKDKIGGKARITVIALFIAFLAHSTWTRANAWSSWPRLAATELTLAPSSAGSNYEIGRVYFAKTVLEGKHNYYNLAREHLLKSSMLDPNMVLGMLAVLRLDAAMQKTEDKNLLKQLLTRLQTQTATAATVQHVNQLLACHIKQNCEVSSSSILSIHQALLKNPSLRGRALAVTLSNLALLALEESNQNLALAYTELALDNYRDDAGIWLSSIYVSTVANKPDRARILAKNFLELPASLGQEAYTRQILNQGPGTRKNNE